MGGQQGCRRQVRHASAPGACGGHDPLHLTAQLKRDVLPLHVVVEVTNHVLPRWPTAGGQRDPLSRKMRQEPGGVEAEVVIARAPRNDRRRCTVDNDRFDAVLMLELTCDSETGWARPDDNSVAAVVDLSAHRDLPVPCGRRKPPV